MRMKSFEQKWSWRRPSLTITTDVLIFLILTGCSFSKGWWKHIGWIITPFVWLTTVQEEQWKDIWMQRSWWEALALLLLCLSYDSQQLLNTFEPNLAYSSVRAWALHRNPPPPPLGNCEPITPPSKMISLPIKWGQLPHSSQSATVRIEWIFVQYLKQQASTAINSHYYHSSYIWTEQHIFCFCMSSKHTKI